MRRLERQQNEWIPRSIYQEGMSGPVGGSIDVVDAGNRGASRFRRRENAYADFFVVYRHHRG
jgi:hypothetical protein